MSKTTTIAKIRPGGTAVDILADGTEHQLPDTPMRPMIEEGIEEAARRPRCPMTKEQFACAKRVPRQEMTLHVRLIREEFAARLRIPLGTLRDWEGRRSEPDRPARAYLTVIARDPDGVRRALCS